MGYLTTHVLDTASGLPAKGLKINLLCIEDGQSKLLKTVVTNQDGRVDGPILSENEFRIGIYELLFFAGAYHESTLDKLPDPLFLNEIPIRFGMADKNAHYHVPLLLSPYGYSTYRGS